MRNIARTLIVAALLGTASIAGQSYAAPGQGAPDCSDPQNAGKPFCVNPDANGRHGHHNTDKSNNNSSQGGDQTTSMPPTQNGSSMDGGNSQGDTQFKPRNHTNNTSAPAGNDNTFNPGDRPHRGDGGDGKPNYQNNGGGDFSPSHNDHRRPHDDPYQFRHLFQGFGFGYGAFARPYFDIQIGIHVPHSYRLRPVPRAIYKYYPEYRGFLFFVTRDGSIVIVSPRSYRIVDII